MEITVNRQKIKLDKAAKLAELPDLLGVQYGKEEKGNFFLSDNNRMIYEIPEDAMTEDGHNYTVFQIAFGG